MKEWIRRFWNTDPFAKWFLGFFLILSTVFLAHYWVVGQAIYGDGIYYYAFTRSLVKDGDIHFVNEYAHHYSPVNNNTVLPEPPSVVENLTPNGYAQNKYGIGAPLFWIIPFTFADVLVNIWNIISLPINGIGFSDVYQILVGLFNVAAVIVGGILLYLFLKKHFNALPAFLAVAVMLFGSNLFYYGSVDVINSHPFSFLTSTVFLLFWWSTLFKRTANQWFALGIIFGILLLIRTQDIVFGILVIAEGIVLLRKQGVGVLAGLFGRYLMFGFGTLLAFVPQLLTWQTIYGDIFTSPYIRGGEGFNFMEPKLLDLFIYPKISILIWTPVFVVSIVGLFLVLKKHQLLAIFSLLLVFTEIYFIASWSGWTQGESFGVRMLISALPFMAVGLAYVLELLLQHFTKRAVYAMCLIIIAINFALIFYFLLLHQNPTNDGTTVTQDRSLEKIMKLLQ